MVCIRYNTAAKPCTFGNLLSWLLIVIKLSGSHVNWSFKGNEAPFIMSVDYLLDYCYGRRDQWSHWSLVVQWQCHHQRAAVTPFAPHMSAFVPQRIPDAFIIFLPTSTIPIARGWRRWRYILLHRIISSMLVLFWSSDSALRFDSHDNATPNARRWHHSYRTCPHSYRSAFPTYSLIFSSTRTIPIARGWRRWIIIKMKHQTKNSLNLIN